jgi:F-type H+-transporting ATPase subunit b
MGPTGMRWRSTGVALLAVGGLILVPAAARAAEGGGVTVIPDWSVSIQIVNFLFLIFALNLLLYRPIRRILKARKEKTQGMEQAIQGADQSVLEKEAAFAKAIRDARARGLKEKETMILAAAAEERRLMEGINAKAQADLEEMRRKIQADAETARHSLQQEIGVFAGQITQKILGRAV